jgi:hypothetical protein
LDEVEDAGQRFGSYRNLVQRKEFRFRDFYRERKASAS